MSRTFKNANLVRDSLPDLNDEEELFELVYERIEQLKSKRGKINLMVEHFPEEAVHKIVTALRTEEYLVVQTGTKYLTISLPSQVN